MVALARFNFGETPIASAKLNAVIDTLTGAANTPVNLAGVNDPINYTLAIRNQDASGKGLVVYAADGATVLLQVQNSGVRASAAGGAALSIVTTDDAQTLTNKIFAAAHLTSPVVDSGGLTISSGGLNVTGNTVTNGLFPGGVANAASDFDIRLPNAHYIGWRNGANTGDIQIGFDVSNQLVLTGVLTSATASAGGVAIPTAATFIQVNVGGSSYKIPLCLP